MKQIPMTFRIFDKQDKKYLTPGSKIFIGLDGNLVTDKGKPAAADRYELAHSLPFFDVNKQQLFTDDGFITIVGREAVYGRPIFNVAENYWGFLTANDSVVVRIPSEFQIFPNAEEIHAGNLGSAIEVIWNTKAAALPAISEEINKAIPPDRSAYDKCISTKHDSICLQRAGDHEPIFVLRAKDPTASVFVRSWAVRNEGIQPDEKLSGAMVLADKMDVWRLTEVLNGNLDHEVLKNSDKASATSELTTWAFTRTREFSFGAMNVVLFLQSEVDMPDDVWEQQFKDVLESGEIFSIKKEQVAPVAEEPELIPAKTPVIYSAQKLQKLPTEIGPEEWNKIDEIAAAYPQQPQVIKKLLRVGGANIAVWAITRGAHTNVASDYFLITEVPASHEGSNS